MNKILLLFLISLTSLTLSSQSKHFKNSSETQEFSKKIVGLFEENKIGEAFDELGLYWPLNQNELSDLRSQTVRYFNLFDERFGKTRGNVKSNVETIQDIAIRETYLILYEFHAIRLIVTYYKNDKGWVINAFKWDDSYTEEFQ